jgi:hypothetical protein
VSYDASVKTVNEDTNTMGARVFFNAAANRNVVNQQVGVNQIDFLKRLKKGKIIGETLVIKGTILLKNSRSPKK